MAETIRGYVEKIVYRNQENGYTVLGLTGEDDDITCVGSFPFINEGEYVELHGNYISHQIYGDQFQVQNYEIKEPEDMMSIERYLGSGAIKGIGVALAARIVRKFKEETFRIIEQEPERLAEVKGISIAKAQEIGTQFEDKKELRDAMLFLQKYGITNNLAVKIYKQYGSRMYEVIKENPYKLADDINGVGFRIADEIAAKVGIGGDAEFRIKAGVLYVLLQASQSGNVYLPMDSLIAKTAQMLIIEPDRIEDHIMDMVIDKKVMIKEIDDRKVVYSTYFYYTELNVARMLHDLNESYDVAVNEMIGRVKKIEKAEKIELDEMQRDAVVEAVRNGVLVITGGPGTGKTTTINTIIRFFEAEGLDFLLAAPTGRAAKRMSETTGYEAQTIHRLLELSGAPDDSNTKLNFERNEENPLEADAIIIDEMSMVDISLMNALLRAITVGTRVILVGDVNQLPSVGPGNVLKDIINANTFHVVKLNKIFRQATESDIIVNAHKINNGEPITLDNKSKDFFMLKRDDVTVIIQVMLTLIKYKMPKYVNAKPYDIQVLTPMRKGELGVERLNQVLQMYLNPAETGKREKEVSGRIFREGDKVMQIKNNYQIEWECKSQFGLSFEKGTGVFNGDTGIIKEINLFSEIITVVFDEIRYVEYSFQQVDELELAYAITIHKSQGSEYPAVIIPVLSGPKMLLHRNLLYTAVTRAKSCVTLVGSSAVVQSMIDNVSEQERYTSLDIRLKEVMN
ncbi:SF1B family DNA helicase RecD2 [Anaerosporobacter sp.]|uniref:SF1B family DNA helicase RecD2 n=1 Tax=Anaerosporobacter sp. TaxID=1872529 RepID=UPI00286F7B8E|nr:ATP-dependent RecD-like DNA helicase [Anaerosporobacter sp.]